MGAIGGRFKKKKVQESAIHELIWLFLADFCKNPNMTQKIRGLKLLKIYIVYSLVFIHICYIIQYLQNLQIIFKAIQSCFSIKYMVTLSK